MKKTLLIALIAFIVLPACDNTKNDESAKKKQSELLKKSLVELEQKGLSSKKVVDTVLLNLRFGMSEKDVHRHLAEMERQGKLHKDYEGKYYYEVDSKMGSNYKGFVFTNYLKDSLVSVGLIFDDPYPLLISSRLDDLYDQKYGAFDIINVPTENVYEKYWIRGNLKIKTLSATAFSKASAEYIDLRKEKQKLAADSLEEASKENEQRKAL